jgi:hypothetical protein
VRDQIKVRRIATPPIFAGVIYLPLTWDIAMVMAEYYNMNRNRLTVEVHPAIATAPTIAGRWPLPLPTACFLAASDAGHDLIHDERAPLLWFVHINNAY